MGSALGVLILSTGVFLIWCGWVGTNPIAEIQGALGVTNGGGVVGDSAPTGGSGGRSFGGGRSSGSW